MSDLIKDISLASFETTLFHNRVRVMAFGRPNDWHLGRNLNNPDYRQNLSGIASLLNVSVLLAPNPSQFNAQLCQVSDLTEIYQLPNTNCEIRRGALADGVIIPPGGGFMIASADCHTIIAYNPHSESIIAAHAGRNCLFDRELIYNRPANRKHASIVDTIMATAPKEEHQAFKIFITCGIHPKYFCHPIDPKADITDETRDYNRRMISHFQNNWGAPCFHGDPANGCINLPEIITRQFKDYDVPEENIRRDRIDTYSDKTHFINDLYPSHTWWSARRHSDEKKPPRERNLIIVANQ